MGGGCSLGKEGNNLMVPGREMKLLVDVRQDQRSLDRKKRGAKAGSMRRTTRFSESRARENRGDFWPEVWPSEGRYARCDDRVMWFKIALVLCSPVYRISSRISIRARASRTLWTTFERREDAKSLTQTFLSFATHTTDFEGLHDRELEGAKDVLQEGECRHLLQR